MSREQKDPFMTYVKNISIRVYHYLKLLLALHQQIAQKYVANLSATDHAISTYFLL